MAEPDDQDRPTALPIVAAAAVVGLVLLAVIGFRLLRGDEISAEAGIGRAVIGQNDALQRADYPAYLRYTCAAERGTEAGVLADERRSAETKGARIVEDVRSFTVDGERATATVVYHFERSADDKVTTEMRFAREDGEWKVCSTGPR